MNFSLYLLLFLLLGTLFFGLAFPFIIAFVLFFFIFFAALWIFRLFRGGSTFTVYTRGSYDETGRMRDNPGEVRGRRVFPSEQTPPRKNRGSRGDYVNVAADDEEMAEATEIVELPSTALRKEDEEE